MLESFDFLESLHIFAIKNPFIYPLILDIFLLLVFELMATVLLRPLWLDSRYL